MGWKGAVRFGALFVFLAILVALAPAPARSQATYLEPREGIWVGEALAYGQLEGGPLIWSGALNLHFDLEADSFGWINGDWVLDGSASMRFDQEASSLADVRIEQSYLGSGEFVDRFGLDEAGGVRDLDLYGDVAVGGTATTDQGTIFVEPQDHPFETRARILQADCYELQGEWVVQLEQLADDDGLDYQDLIGYFHASFVGDELDDRIRESIERLWSDIKTWSDDLFDTSVADEDRIFDLIFRAREISLARAAAESCDSSAADPETYVSGFTAGITLGMFNALKQYQWHDPESLFKGSDLRVLAAALGALGSSAGESAVASEIQNQTQEIVRGSVSAEGATCGPCVNLGSEENVMNAAIAGKLLGQEFEVDGERFSPDAIIRAAAGE